MAFSPILLLAGIIFVCFYIVTLVTKLEDGDIHTADRFDLAYRLVFSFTLILLVVRSFLGDFMGGGTNLNIQYEVIIPAIISGLITWLTPKIRDNDNPDF